MSILKLKNFYTVKIELRTPDGLHRAKAEEWANVRAASLLAAGSIIVRKYDKARVWAVEVSRNRGPV